MTRIGSWGRLAVGLTSLEMLKAVTEYTKRTSRPLMLIASRNQVERADLGGVYFEVGTDGDDGIPAEPKQVQSDLERILEIVKPSYYVAQTGSLVREGRQAGHFDARAANVLVSLLGIAGVAVLLSGHYHYSSEPYQLLVADLELRTDISGAISSALQERIDWYYAALSGSLTSGTPHANALGRRGVP